MKKNLFIGLILIAIGAIVYGIVWLNKESSHYTHEEKHEIVSGRIVEKYITSGFLGLSERYSIPILVDGKQVLFHASIKTGLKVSEGQVILLSKTVYVTRRDGILIKSASYYNWYNWE